MTTMEIFLKSHEYNPPTQLEFWCSVCDNVAVNSSKTDSGKFFTFHGHTFSQKTKVFDGAYLGVCLAVCTKCLTT